jgi:hypothetical protein
MEVDRQGFFGRRIEQRNLQAGKKAGNYSFHPIPESTEKEFQKIVFDITN